MRLWTLHPKYLDVKGLLALWREGLLAQKVLRGETAGYTQHPQLRRFRGHPDPRAAISAYLVVYEEARRRDYRFDKDKIVAHDTPSPIRTTRGQLLYEWAHLKRKLQDRDPGRLSGLLALSEPEAHPLFEIVPGEIESWERQIG